MDEQAYNATSPEIQNIADLESDGRYYLSLNEWNSSLFNAGTYPELRIFKNVFKRVCEQTKNDESLQLLVVKKARFLNWQREKETFRCDSI